jgi:serine/threonine protein kinase
MFPPRPLPEAIEGFEVLERLGFGAAGEVFLAKSPGGQLVAIKTLPGGEGSGAWRPPGSVPDEGGGPPSERGSSAFLREASVSARLRHPCIVQVRALLSAGGVPALVFEYVPGVTLARVLRLSDARGVRLPDVVAWHIVDRVLQALAYAHAFCDAAGKPTPIVHRDLSPANVLLDWSGGAKIADFGIAKVMGVSPATRFGLVKGTPGCMAPEQARGEAVDERADVYAAALLAWRLATGRPPFGRHVTDEFELLRAMRNPRIKPLDVIRPDLPAPLLAAIARALEPDRDARTITAAELGDALRAAVDLEDGEADLEALLAKWKPALAGAVKRAADADSDHGRLRQVHTLRYEEVALAFEDEVPADAPTFEGHALPSEPWPVARPQGEASPGEERTSDGALPLPPLPLPERRSRPPAPSSAVLSPESVTPDASPGAAHASSSRRMPSGGPPVSAQARSSLSSSVDPSPSRPSAPRRSRSRAPATSLATVWAPVLALAGFAAVGLLAGLLATCVR